jgi:hypothetical protein
MNGYAAAARIRSASPHLVAGTSRRGELAMPSPAAETEVLLVEAADDPRPIAGPGLGERWSAICERWSQLTFYLTDANSWR